MIAEVFLKEAEAMLAPVSAAEPGGKNPSADERYQELRVEVDKENSPIGEAVRWGRVAELGADILSKVAKDLLVAAYTGFALYKTRGIHGLAVGVVLLDGLLDRYWDTMFPPVARLKGRGTAVKWLLEHAVTGLASYQPQPADRAAITALMTAAKQLRGRAREKFGDHVPSFKELTDLLESIQATLPPEEPKVQVPADMFSQPAASSAAPPPVVPPPVVPPPVVPSASSAAPPPVPPPAPAAPARPTPKDLAGPWLAPIPGASPAGKDPIEGLEYQTILAEIDKLQSPTGGAPNWATIVGSADTLLKGQAKDLRVACHQALARYKTGRLEGLALGFAILAEVADAFWDTAFPPPSRLRGRAGALRGMFDQIEPELAALQPKPGDRATLERRLLEVRYEIAEPLLGEVPLLSAPGVFCRKHLDDGSRALLTALAAAEPPAPKRVLDLGAGIGPLGLWAARRWPEAQVLAVESNAIAAGLVRENAGRLGCAERVEVSLSDGLPAEHPRRGGFDLALVNPPTHAPPEAFAELVKPLPAWLRAGGEAWFVVNRSGRLLQVLKDTRAEVEAREVPGFWIVRARWG